MGRWWVVVVVAVVAAAAVAAVPPEPARGTGDPAGAWREGWVERPQWGNRLGALGEDGVLRVRMLEGPGSRWVGLARDVAAFQLLDWSVAVLGRDGTLWYATGPLDTPLVEVARDVAAFQLSRDWLGVLYRDGRFGVTVGGPVDVVARGVRAFQVRPGWLALLGHDGRLVVFRGSWPQGDAFQEIATGVRDFQLLPGWVVFRKAERPDRLLAARAGRWGEFGEPAVLLDGVAAFDATVGPSPLGTPFFGLRLAVVRTDGTVEVSAPLAAPGDRLELERLTHGLGEVARLRWIRKGILLESGDGLAEVIDPSVPGGTLLEHLDGVRDLVVADDRSVILAHGHTPELRRLLPGAGPGEGEADEREASAAGAAARPAVVPERIALDGTVARAAAVVLSGMEPDFLHRPVAAPGGAPREPLGLLPHLAPEVPAAGADAGVKAATTVQGGTLLPAVSIDVGADGTVLVATGGVLRHVWRWTGSGWAFARGRNVTGVSVASRTLGAIRKSNGALLRWDGTNFQRLPGSGTDIDVASDGRMWGIGNARDVYQWNGSGWVRRPGSLRQISVGRYVVGTDTSDRVYYWNGSGWVQLPGRLRQVEIASDVNQVEAWGVNGAGSVYRWNGSGWTRMPGASAREVGVGGSGKVWGITTDGRIWQWNGSGWVERPRPRAHRISGTVYVGGVTVTAIKQDWPQGIRYTTTSSGDGGYTLWVPPGRYTVSAAKSGCSFTGAQTVTVGPSDRIGLDFATPCALNMVAGTLTPYIAHVLENWSFFAKAWDGAPDWLWNHNQGGPPAREARDDWIRCNGFLDRCTTHTLRCGGVPYTVYYGADAWDCTYPCYGCRPLKAPPAPRHWRASFSQWGTPYYPTGCRDLGGADACYAYCGSSSGCTWGWSCPAGGTACTFLGIADRYGIISLAGVKRCSPTCSLHDWSVIWNGPGGRVLWPGEHYPDGYFFLPAQDPTATDDFYSGWAVGIPTGKRKVGANDPWESVASGDVYQNIVYNVPAPPPGADRRALLEQGLGGGSGPQCWPGAEECIVFAAANGVVPGRAKAARFGDTWVVTITGFNTTWELESRYVADYLADEMVLAGRGSLHPLLERIYTWATTNNLEDRIVLHGHSLGAADALVLYNLGVGREVYTYAAPKFLPNSAFTPKTSPITGRPAGQRPVHHYCGTNDPICNGYVDERYPGSTIAYRRAHGVPITELDTGSGGLFLGTHDRCRYERQVLNGCPW